MARISRSFLPQRAGSGGDRLYELASVLSPDGLTLVSGCSAERAHDVVVTEYGSADLRGLSHSGRAFALIEIAGPLRRPALAAAWAEYAKLL